MITFDKRAFKDIQRIRKKFDKLSEDIKLDTQNKVQEVGHLGFNFAFGLAPEYTGALKAAMRLEFPETDQFIIISAHPSGDVLPIHVLFDTGDYPAVTHNIPRNPANLFFMQKTFVLLQKEFAERLGLAFSHSIEKFGKSRGGK